jgi:chromosome segregation ATPase
MIQSLQLQQAETKRPAMEDDEDGQPPEDVEQEATAAAMTVREQAADGFRRLQAWCLGKHSRGATKEALNPRKRLKLSHGNILTGMQEETTPEAIKAISTPRPAKQPRIMEAEAALKDPETETRDREFLEETVNTLKAENLVLEEERKKQDAETSRLKNRIRSWTARSHFDKIQLQTKSKDLVEAKKSEAALKKLEKETRNREETVKNLKVKNLVLEEERKKQDAETSRLTNRIKALTAQSHFDKIKLKTKSKDLVEAKQNTKSLASKLRSSTEKLESYALQKTKADAVIDDLQRQVEESKSIIGKLQLQVESALQEKLKLSEVMEHVKKHKSTLGASREEIESYIEEKAKADALIDDFGRQTEQTQSKMAELTQQVKSEDDAKEKLSKLIGQVDNRQSDLQSSKDKLESYALQNTKADAVIVDLQHQVQQTKLTIAKLQQPVESTLQVKLMLSELREQVAKLKSDLRASWEEINYSVQEKAWADSVIKDLKCQAEQLKSKIDGLQGKKLSELMEEVEKLKSFLRESRIEIDSYAKERTNSESVIEDLRRQVEQSKAAIGQPQPHDVGPGGLHGKATIGQPQPRAGPGGLPGTNPFWQPKATIGQPKPQVGPGRLPGTMHPFFVPKAIIGQPQPQDEPGRLPGMHPFFVPNWYGNFQANSSMPFTPSYLPPTPALPAKKYSGKDEGRPSPSYLRTKKSSNEEGKL